MKHDFDARHLNIEAFARDNGRLDGSALLTKFGRLADEAQDPIDGAIVRFLALGSTRPIGVTGEQIWLHLTAEVAFPMVCQRCLGPVDMPVQLDREFRFVATEELAEAEDEDSEEDVLVSSRDFNVLELVEDELLMALPVVPKHPVCPGAVKLQAADPDFVDEPSEKPNPFAVLERLKGKPVL